MSKIGFPIDWRYRYRLNDRLYRINDDGVRALSILTELHNACAPNRDANWCLRMRDDIRVIESLDVRPLLTHVIEKTPDALMRILAIWLRGRCGGYIGTCLLARYATSTDFTTRKEAVRALRRMSGWSILRDIANSDPSPRIRTMATQRAQKPLADRLSTMLKNCKLIQLDSGKRQAFWMFPGLLFRPNTGKTLNEIRQILVRIRDLVASTKR